MTKARSTLPAIHAICLWFALGGCGSGRLEPLGVSKASPKGTFIAEMFLKPGKTDGWVLRIVRPRGGPRRDVTLPSIGSSEGTRWVSRRKPKIFWEPAETRILVETIGSGFVMVYLPEEPGAAPFVCDHRVLSPEDVSESFRRTPTLQRLAAEILSDPDKPHGPAEQSWVLRRIEAAGPASEAAAAIVGGVLLASDGVDPERLTRLAVARLRPGSGLPAATREAEMARLREPLALFARRPSRDGARTVRRAGRVLGLLADRESAALVVSALEVATTRGAAPLEAGTAADAIVTLAWLAGALGIAEGGPPIAAYLEQRNEVPYKTRVARCVAAWAAVRLGRSDALVPLYELLDDPIAWTAGGARLAFPAEEEALRSAAWADDLPLAIAVSWGAVRTRDRRAAAPLSAVLARRDVPGDRAAVAARALLEIDPALARPAIEASACLTDRDRRSLLGR